MQSWRGHLPHELVRGGVAQAGGRTRAPGHQACGDVAAGGQAAAGPARPLTGGQLPRRYVVTGLVAETPSGDARDQEEITAFYVAFREPIRRWLIASGCSALEAEDVVHDSILAVRERWARVRTLDRPQAYWYKVAWRLFAREQALQAARYLTGDPDERLKALPDPADAVAAVDRRELAMALLRELPLRQRQVFWLRRAAGFSTKGTASILSIVPGTVKSQLHDAEVRVQELADKYGDDAWDMKADPR
jgi:RNA polymerase sigma factor (sigma-70 family)